MAERCGAISSIPFDTPLGRYVRNIVCTCAAVGFFSSASDRRIRDFCGFSSSDAMKPSSSSLSSTFRPTRPVTTRELRTTMTPFLTAAAAAVTAALVMLPFPTPAMTMPLAPRPRPRRSGLRGMSTYAKMMSTRGIWVTDAMSNSVCVVCFHSGRE